MSIPLIKPRIGRPPVDSEPVNVRMLRRDLAAIDAWIEEQPKKMTRAEAIRQLVHQALNVS